jgi:hypothetical protein
MPKAIGGYTVWNYFGRHHQGKRIFPRVDNREDVFACPLCDSPGRPHAFAEPKLRNCDLTDCGWRSCIGCSVTWSVRTGNIMQILRPPTKVYLER